MKAAIVYIRDGELTSIGEMPSPLLELGPSKKERASTIVPVNPRTAKIFHFLRRSLGEKVGGWLSRRLPGPWQATILRTGDLYFSYSRARCVAWEILELQKQLELN